MKTLIGLIIFEVFAFFAVLFYYEAKKPVAPPYKADVDHIEHLNDSMTDKLNSDIKRFDSSLNQSKSMLNQVEILTKQNK